jgi:SH3-like domain-containing protein
MIQRICGKTIRTAAVLIVGLAGIGAAPPASPYMSLSHDKAFVREGPSYQHRVLWIYHRKELPVEVVQSYDVWRKIRDSDGTMGWVNGTMLSDRRTVVVTAQAPAKIRAADVPNAKVMALAQPGVVARLEACEADACEITADGTEGWIQKQDVWGVSAGEVFR